MNNLRCIHLCSDNQKTSKIIKQSLWNHAKLQFSFSYSIRIFLEHFQVEKIIHRNYRMRWFLVKDQLEFVSENVAFQKMQPNLGDFEKLLQRGDIWLEMSVFMLLNFCNWNCKKQPEMRENSVFWNIPEIVTDSGTFWLRFPRLYCIKRVTGLPKIHLDCRVVDEYRDLSYLPI